MNIAAGFPSKEIIDGALRDVFSTPEFSEKTNSFLYGFLKNLYDIFMEILNLPKEQLDIISTVIKIAAVLFVAAIIVVIILLLRRSVRIKHEKKTEQSGELRTETLDDALSKRNTAAFRGDFSHAIVFTYYAYLHYLANCGLITISDGKTTRAYYYELGSRGYGALELFGMVSSDYLSARFGGKMFGEERYLYLKTRLSFIEEGGYAKTAG